MKKIISKSIFLITIFLCFFMSCASSKKETAEYIYDDEYELTEIINEPETIEAPEIRDDFLGDFDPIQIKNTMALLKSNKNMKPKELSKTYLIPRNNTIEITFRTTANEVTVIFNKAERIKLAASINLFLNGYENKTLPHHKVNSKTAYYNSKCSYYFGLLGSNNGCDENDYWTNCEIIEKKAYFVLHLSPTQCKDSSAFTPKLSLYFSPSQCRDFLEILDQDYLNEQVKELREKAYTY